MGLTSSAKIVGATLFAPPMNSELCDKLWESKATEIVLGRLLSP